MKIKCWYDNEPDAPVWFELPEFLTVIGFMLDRMAQDERKPRLTVQVEADEAVQGTISSVPYSSETPMA